MHGNLEEILKEFIKNLKLGGRINVELCIIFLQEMLVWNKKHKLTTIVEPYDMAAKHVADSLSIHPFIQGNTLADVGSGAGFPGIPLALLFPEKNFTLIESQNKKAAFLRHIQRTLKLDHVTIIQQRVETYRPEKSFDMVLTRAFSSLSHMLKVTKHLCNNTGSFLAMKGEFPTEELHAIAHDYPNYKVEALSVPGLQASRHCVIVQQRKTNV